MSIAQTLTTLGTATLFEAHPGCAALDPAIARVWACPALAGPVFPVETAPMDNLAIQLALETAPRGAILAVDAHRARRGYWGEVLTVAAQARGLIGLVIDGGVRDIDAMEALGFPVFSRHVAIMGTGKEHAPGVGRPCYVGGARVTAGDWIVADRDGIVVFAETIMTDLIERAQARTDKERTMMEELRAGKTMIDLLGLEGKRALIEPER